MIEDMMQYLVVGRLAGEAHSRPGETGTIRYTQCSRSHYAVAQSIKGSGDQAEGDGGSEKAAARLLIADDAWKELCLILRSARPSQPRSRAKEDSKSSCIVPEGCGICEMQSVELFHHAARGFRRLGAPGSLSGRCTNLAVNHAMNKI